MYFFDIIICWTFYEFACKKVKQISYISFKVLLSCQISDCPRVYMFFSFLLSLSKHILQKSTLFSNPFIGHLYLNYKEKKQYRHFFCMYLNNSGAYI